MGLILAAADARVSGDPHVLPQSRTRRVPDVAGDSLFMHELKARSNNPQTNVVSRTGLKSCRRKN